MIDPFLAVVLMCAAVFLVVVAHQLAFEWALLIVTSIILLAWASGIIG